MYQLNNLYLWISNDLFLIIIALFIIITLYKATLYILKPFYLKPLLSNSKDKALNPISKLGLDIIDLRTIDLRKIIKAYIFSSDLKKIDLDKRQIINTINPHSYCVSRKDLLFKKALINSDILLPDGSGIVLASRFLFGRRIKKIAGADIHAHLLQHAHLNKKKVFYLGATQNTLDLITKKLKIEYPNIQVASYSPPFKSEFNSEDTKQMIDIVNVFKPDILFVGMTAPKQEKWVEKNKINLSPKTIVSIGAVFDFYAGTVKRSDPFWINLGLEWLPRLIREPRRLWRRNFISTPLFLLSLGKAKLNF